MGFSLSKNIPFNLKIIIGWNWHSKSDKNQPIRWSMEKWMIHSLIDLFQGDSNFRKINWIFGRSYFSNMNSRIFGAVTEHEIGNFEMFICVVIIVIDFLRWWNWINRKWSEIITMRQITREREREREESGQKVIWIISIDLYCVC